ncbi:hypothetical protein FRC04_011249 [Tulasnella sp. 424]|nr:hypothetical protein FRC04_011249 [Tulasnella sp. 424]
MASPSAAKKRKITETGNKNHQLIETVTDVNALLDPLETILSLRNKIKVLRVALGDVVKKDFNEAILKVLNQPFSVGGDQATRAAIGYVNDKLSLLSEEYQRRLDYGKPIPPPSLYAKRSIWADWQQKSTAILCFRPSDKQGLPLCVLDHVFREFQRQARAPLPLTEDARKAMNAAFDLCHMMPSNFDTEYDRGRVFDRCLDPILPYSSWGEKAYTSAPKEGQAGRIYKLGGVVRILREDKVEIGTGDDVYMQMSRTYQLHVENVRKENPSLFKQGVPVFLLCVLGPMLLICGGFHDTNSTIVEPLVEPCLMFGDCLHVRQEALARKLFALKQAFDTLRSRSRSDGATTNPHPAGVPRVYTTYTTEDNTERSLTFLRTMEESLSQHPLFIAAEDLLDSSTHRLVKLVGKDYGVGAHRLLAERQFAPKLYGQKSLESAPTAYIMEYLSPPTHTQSGWVTLFKFFKLDDLASQYSHAIWNTLDRILTMMEEAKVVHGDLRPNNVLLEVDSDDTPVCSGEEQEVNLRVVDFDWAGQSGEVCYPLQRNEDITWPGDAGTPIIGMPVTLTSIWADWQKKPTAILCFRPSDKQGLPLCVLDNVFREFQRQVRTPLPSTPDARKAMNAAFDLCHAMPNNFDIESDRGKVFDKCLDPILPLLSWRSEVRIEAPTELRTGQAGRTYEPNGVVLILREDKLETGTGDDVYMQVSRVYQLYVEKVRGKDSSLLEQGVPVFLLCVLGPMLLICGGFHDGKSTIVEPLVEPCLMFGDCLHVRQEALARQLFALKQALDTLSSRSRSNGATPNPHPAGVPRVYTTYTTEDNTERSLTFLRPLEESQPQYLLFITAEDPPDSSTHKLVKLVGKGYGVTAHRLLAERQVAPVLYGQSSLEGAPTAYIMEYLSPPTDSQSGWVTLFEFLKSKDLATRYSHLIGTALTRILMMMEEAKVVHGDLRPNNVMLEVNSDKTPVCSGKEQNVNLKVIDFDWAGQSGEVCYPLQRNEDITWPGDAGTPIIVGHDRLMVKDWWFKQFT